MMVHAPRPLHAPYYLGYVCVFYVMTYDVMLYMHNSLHHVVNEMKYYLSHVISCHIKICDRLCDECHVYMMHICTMSLMKLERK